MKEKIQCNNGNKMFKIIVIIIIVILIILFIQFMLSPARGKDYVIVVEDYSYDGDRLDESVPWNTKPRMEMREYMEENNFVLKPGRYKIYQGISFEDALEILEFIQKE